jgi:outer membrane protein
VRSISAIVLTFVWATGMAAGQEAAGQARRLTLQECVDLAMQQNPGIAIADQGVRSAEAGERGARSAYFPQLEARNDYEIVRSRGGRRVIAGGGAISFSGQLTEQDTHGLYLSQTIMQSGRTDVVRQARHQARAERHAATDVRRQLVETVATQYYAVLANRRLLTVSQQSEAFEEENVRIVQGRVNAGLAAQVDVRPALTARASAQLDVVRASNAVDLALAQLKYTLGLPPTESIDLAESLKEEAREVKLEDALNEAYEKRPDLAEQQQRVEAQRDAVRIARSNVLPQLTVTGASSYDVLDGYGGFAYQLGASLSYPVFDGGATQSSLDGAKANLKSAQAALDQVRLSVGLDVENAVLNLGEAAQAIQAAQAAVDEAQANFDAMQGRLQEGLVTTQDVTEAEVQLTTARVQQVQAIYNYNVAEAALDAAIGRQ